MTTAINKPTRNLRLYARLFTSIGFIFQFLYAAPSQAQQPLPLNDFYKLNYSDIEQITREEKRLTLDYQKDSSQRNAIKQQLLTTYLQQLKGRYFPAIAANAKARQIAALTNDSLAQIQTRFHFAQLLYQKGFTTKAIEHYFYLLESKQDSALTTALYYEIARCYWFLEDPSNAKNYLAKAKPFPFLEIPISYLKAEIELATNNLDSALYLVNKNYQKALDQKSTRYTIYGLYLRGDIELSQQNAKKALLLYREANSIIRLKKSYYYFEYILGQQKIAAAYNELKDTKKAEETLKKAILLTKKTRANSLLKTLYLQLAEHYAEQEKFEAALSAFTRYSELKNAQFKQDKLQQVAEIETRYKTKELTQAKNTLTDLNKNQALEIELKEKALKLQALKNSQNFFVIIVLTSLILLVGFIAFLLIRQLGLKAQIRESVLKQEALQSQMNPHFLFNALNSVQSLIATGDNSTASIVLARFSRLMRSLLQNSRQRFIPLESELEFIENYISLEQQRFKSSFDVEINTDALDELHALEVPPLVLQPFIENALIHGLLPKKGKGLLHIHFEHQDQYFIRCIVQDNGIGRTAASKINRQKQHESLGLDITRQRLEQLSNQKVAHIRFNDLKNEDGSAAGTAVSVLLPLKQ